MRGPRIMCADVVRCTSTLCVARYEYSSSMPGCGCRVCVAVSDAHAHGAVVRGTAHAETRPQCAEHEAWREVLHVSPMLPHSHVAHVTAQMRPGAATPMSCSTGSLGDKKSRARVRARACARVRVRVPSQELTAGLDSQSTTCSSATDSLAAVGWESPLWG